MSPNRAQDLAAAILSAAGLPEIVAACSAVESFLRRHVSDQSGPFFSLALPALLRRLFGFDDSPSGPTAAAATCAWLDRAAGDPAVANRLFALLAPDGILLSSVLAVDRRARVRYVFPTERLPEWIRVILRSRAVRSNSAIAEISPVLRGRVKEEKLTSARYLQLNVFEYYMFWFAYYPVCRGRSDSSSTRNATCKNTSTFWIVKLFSSFPMFSSTGLRSGQTLNYSLYMRLFYAYLRAFVPKNGLESYQPYRSSLLHYSLSYDETSLSQAEFVVHALVNFWIVDNDFSPFPVNVTRSFGLSFVNPSVSGEAPPTPGLGDVIKLFVTYLNCKTIDSVEGNALISFAGSPVSKGSADSVNWRNVNTSCEGPVVSWNAIIQRPLYRFILRSLLFFPVGASIKDASQVFSLWVSYLEPWKTSPGYFSEFDHSEVQNSESASNQKDGCTSRYSSVWKSYVLANYLFYSSLVVHFLGFAHKFLHANVGSIIEMVSQVLNILTSSSELLELLRKFDLAYHSKHTGSLSNSSNDVYNYIPAIREELLDWEDGLCESGTDGSFLRENWNHDLKLFCHTDNGALKLLQLLVLRAEHEIHLASGDVSNNLQVLESIRSQMNILFGGSLSKDSSSTTQEENYPRHERSNVFTPKHPGVGARKLADRDYKGDWMLRPIMDTEVAWLAKLLIKLSDRLNQSLGLDHRENGDSMSPMVVDLSHEEIYDVGAPKEALRVVFKWIKVFGNTAVSFMRAKGLRVNLRVLASKKILVLLILYLTFIASKKVFKAAFSVSWQVTCYGSSTDVCSHLVSSLL